MRPRARLLLGANAFHPSIGGYEAVAMFLAQGLAREYDVTVVTETPGRGGEEDLPFRIVRNPTRSNLKNLGRNADLIVLNSLSFRFFYVLFPYRAKLVVVQHSAYDETSSFRVRLLERLKRSASRLVRLNICVSEFVAGRLGGARMVIHNPYDETLFRMRQGERARAILFVGRLTHEKGADTLIEAVSALQQRRPGWPLSIFGVGPEQPKLEALVAAKGLGGAVRFAGGAERARIASEMTRHPILVVPSRRETYGIVALEGLASGCRVVHSDVGGLPEAAGGFGIAYAAAGEDALVRALEAAIDEIEANAPAKPPGLDAFLADRSRPRVLARYVSVIEEHLGHPNA